MLVLALARGPAIAFAVALLITALPRRGHVNARRVSTLFLVGLLAAVALYASKGLWLARLDAPTTAGFDRPATWVAGLRLVQNHPLVGVGSTHAVQVITSSSEYSQTQFGDTGDLPHNAWLYAAAANGALYGIVLVVLTVLFVVELAHCKGPPETRYLKAGLAGLALVFFENNLFNHPEVMLVVLLAAAIIATASDPPPDGPADAAVGVGHPTGWSTASGQPLLGPRVPSTVRRDDCVSCLARRRDEMRQGGKHGPLNPAWVRRAICERTLALKREGAVATTHSTGHVPHTSQRRAANSG